MSNAIGGSALFARWRALLRPPRSLRTTPAGRICMIITLGVGVGALNTGNNLLYLVLGLLLSAIVVSGVLSERSLGPLSVRRLGTDAAFAGEPFAFRWLISRPKGSSFALEISEAATDLQGEGKIAHLTAGVEQSVRATLLAPTRGPRQLTGIKISTRYPFGFFIKSRVVPSPGTLLVYPGRQPAAASNPLSARHQPLGESANPHRGGGSGDLLDLRELRPGEDARRIHWIKSASAGKLLRAEREQEERDTFVLRLEANLSGGPLERRCAETAAIARRLLSQGYNVGLEAEGSRLRPSHGAIHERRILEALAWIGFQGPQR